MAPHAVESPHNSTAYGREIVQSLQDEDDSKSGAANGTTSEHDLVLKTFRLLIADLCQQFKGGHPGGAIGMAAIGVALWKYVMRYAPHSPNWFNRDRFVLSNGHTCLFQYTFLHLTGYKGMTLDQLKSYHSDRPDALCPGHPEIEHEGIEVTTGPLGQGVANSVGLAIAGRHLAAQFNRPDFVDIVSGHVWCMVGDACLQEGVALEAISLAGHLRLGNLTMIYDNNQITCDGSVDLTNTEDVNAKMRACGWNVVEILDGSFDVESITSALEASRRSDVPTFVNVHTIIGLGSAVANTAVAHGVAFGDQDVQDMKRTYGFDPETFFEIPQAVHKFFADLPRRGEDLVNSWKKRLHSYGEQYPELHDVFNRRLQGDSTTDWEALIPQEFPQKKTPTRASSGLVFNPIAANAEQFIVGTADLSPSVHMSWKGMETFQSPANNKGSYAGRYIHYGIREHAMAAVANGIAAYHPNMLIPVTSSFFMFYLYAAPAVRMGALQRLQVIHAATHDSIGMGEDGPTHQPIELAALYRAMPNVQYIRPADSEETAGAWSVAIQSKTTPTIISTSRHAVPQLTGLTDREKVGLGAYVLQEAENADLTIVGVGAELSLALEAADCLRRSDGLMIRVVSFPSVRLFEYQSAQYKRSVLRRNRARPIVVIEPYAAAGWERYANAAICMGTERFGQSLPGPKVYEFFGFGTEAVVNKLRKYHEMWRNSDDDVRLEFTEVTEVGGVVSFKQS